MSDLIDRQAAIAFVDCGYLRPPTELAWSDKDVVDMLKRLPYAQPEKTQLSGESTTKDSTFDCISRQAAINAPVRMVSEGIEWIPVYHVEQLPSAQPVRKTGQWIKRKKGAIGYNCSCCGKSDISNHFDYCPNCGAWMRGEEDASSR